MTKDLYRVQRVWTPGAIFPWAVVDLTTFAQVAWFKTFAEAMERADLLTAEKKNAQ